MQESRSRRGDCWAGREVTLATETGHPYRAAAWHSGMSTGFGVTLFWVRILAPQLHRQVTLGEATLTFPSFLFLICKMGENIPSLWGVTRSNQRKCPGLYKQLPNGGPQGAQAGISSRVGAQTWAALPELVKKWCQATSLPRAEAT